MEDLEVLKREEREFIDSFMKLRKKIKVIMSG